MISTIKSIFCKLICKHKDVFIGGYVYANRFVDLVFVDEYKCSNCGRCIKLRSGEE